METLYTADLGTNDTSIRIERSYKCVSLKPRYHSTRSTITALVAVTFEYVNVCSSVQSGWSKLPYEIQTFIIHLLYNMWKNNLTKLWNEFNFIAVKEVVQYYWFCVIQKHAQHEIWGFLISYFILHCLS